MSAATLDGVTMENVNLREAVLKDATMKNGNLRKVDISFAECKGFALSNTYQEGMTLNGIKNFMV